MDFYEKKIISDLYKKMTDENFIGEYSIDDNCLIWNLDNGITIKISFNVTQDEGYIEVHYFDGKKKIYLTHWHPETDEIYEDLFEINTGNIFWIVKKKGVFENLPVIIYKSEWEKFSDKKKNRYSIL